MNARPIRRAGAFLKFAGLVGCLAWLIQALPSDAAEMQDDPFPGAPPDDFFAGHYVLIGQRPAQGAAYKGRARIELTDHHRMRLVRTITGVAQVIDGTFVPSGESKTKSLQFRWRDNHRDAQMDCQYSVDFNNYPRLSCMWSYGGRRPGDLPGFESYYPVDGLSENQHQGSLQMRPFCREAKRGGRPD